MEGGLWKARIESALASIGRDIGDMYRQATSFLGHLSMSERLVLIGLALMGTLYLLISHIARRRKGEAAESRFVGILFGIVAIAAGAGWLIASDRVA
ncbi:MAG TPA: hypothetical protein DCY26_16575 [Hyphomonas sp.]|nr:hypothetical protein [Hyphomonas sp.]